MLLKKVLEKSKSFWAFDGLKFNLLVKTDVTCLLFMPVGLELSYLEILTSCREVSNASYKVPESSYQHRCHAEN